MKHLLIGLALAIVAHHSNRPVKAMTIEAGQEEDSDYAIRGSIMTDKDEKEESNRKARLFWGTITTATSTVSSTTACYATAGTPTTACSKRRKRAIEMNPFGDHEMQEKIMATSPVRISRMNNKKKAQSVRRSKVMDLNQVAFEGRGGQSAWEPASGRFLSFYWYTSTTTSTKTTYTKTTTFTITACTPAGSFSYSACG